MVSGGATAARRGALTAPGVGWVLVGIWSVLALLLYVSDRERPFHAGAFTDVDITLVSSDAAGLACSLDATPFGYSCGFDSSGKPRVLPATRRLQPGVTLKRDVLLVPALFEEPEIGRNVARDLEGRTPGEARRFTAHCKVRLLTRVHGARLRYLATDAFGPPEDAWLASLVGCSVASSGM